MRNPRKMVGGAKLHVDSNPTPTRDTWRAQTKPCVHQDPRTPQRKSQTCVCISCRGAGEQWSAAGSGAPCAASRVTQPVAQAILEKVTTIPPKSRQADDPQTAEQSHQNILALLKNSRTHNRFPNLGVWKRDWEPSENLTLEASQIWLQNLHRAGETDSWRAQTKACTHQDPGERSSDPTRDWPRLACECLGVSSGGMGRWWPAAGLGRLSAVWLCVPRNFQRRSPLSSLPLP